MSDDVVLLYDFNGQPVVSSAAPVTNRPGTKFYSPQGGIVVLGSDYASSPSAQVPKVDASGNQYMVPVNSAGTAVQVQNQASAGTASAAYGQLAMALYGTTYQALLADVTGSLQVRHNVYPTFAAIASGVSTLTGKSMLSLVNTTSSAVVIRLVAVYAENVSNVTGGLLSGQSFNNVVFELRPVTSASGGTSVPIVAYDQADSISSAVTCQTNATVTGDTIGALRRWAASNYGVNPGVNTSEETGGFVQDSIAQFSQSNPDAKVAVIRPGAGIHLKCVGPATVGTFDFTFIFTQAAA